jgi:hypothetical protein
MKNISIKGRNANPAARSQRKGSNMGSFRTTTGIVDRVEPNGVVFVHEDAPSRKLGFLGNSTPVRGPARPRLKPGTRLSLDVEDRGNVMVVAAARIVG